MAPEPPPLRQTKAPTLKDVAKLAGVSVSTTSRALGGHPAITAATVAKVRAAAEQVHYRPNAQARALRAARTGTIGLTIPSVINPYFAALAAAVQQAAGRAQLATILFNSNENADDLSRALQVLQDHRVDGIIAVPHEDNLEQLAATRNRGIPIVLADRELPGTDIPSVSSDPAPGMNAAVSHLAAQGHRSIGYLAGPLNTSTGRYRLSVFEAAATAARLPGQPVYHGGYQQSQGYAGTGELLGRGVSAIIAGDSMMTIGALEACHERQLKVGTDIALIGFDDNPVFRLQAAPLTVIDQNVTELGIRSFEVLQDLMSGKSPPTITRLPTTLRIRDSSGPPPEHSAASTTPPPLPDVKEGGAEFHERSSH